MSETVENKTVITINGVLALLEQGKTRKEIAEHFGKTQTEMQKIVWSHPKLKGRKIKKQYGDSIMLVDDTEEDLVGDLVPNIEVQEEEVVTNEIVAESPEQDIFGEAPFEPVVSEPKTVKEEENSGSIWS